VSHKAGSLALSPHFSFTDRIVTGAEALWRWDKHPKD
jgi:hypothetical protein